MSGFQTIVTSALVLFESFLKRVQSEISLCPVFFLSLRGGIGKKYQLALKAPSIFKVYACRSSPLRAFGAQ